MSPSSEDKVYNQFRDQLSILPYKNILNAKTAEI